MATDINLVRQRVQSLLTANFEVQLHPNDEYSVVNGSTRVFITVNQVGDSFCFVHLMAPVLIDAPVTAELYEYVATTDPFIFGRLLAKKEDDGTVTVLLTHSLLGDFLDEAELGYAVAGIAGSADELDDELVGKFGGRVLHAD